MKRMEGLTRRGLLHGHKDLRRRLVRQQRRANGRKVGTIGPRDPTWWNIVANAAIRTGSNAFDRLVPGAGPPCRRASGAHIVSQSSTTTTSVSGSLARRPAAIAARFPAFGIRSTRSQYSAATRPTARSPPPTAAISSDGRFATTLARASRRTSSGSSYTGTRTDVRRPVGEAVEGRYRRATRAFAVHSSHAVDQGGHTSGRGDSVR